MANFSRKYNLWNNQGITTFPLEFVKLFLLHHLEQKCIRPNYQKFQSYSLLQLTTTFNLNILFNKLLIFIDTENSSEVHSPFQTLPPTNDFQSLLLYLKAVTPTHPNDETSVSSFLQKVPVSFCTSTNFAPLHQANTASIRPGLHVPIH